MSPLDRLRWLRAVAGTPGTEGSPLAVAVVIAGYLNAESGSARPAVATIAVELHIDPRTVQRSARVLESAGLLTVEHTAGRACCTYTPNPGVGARVQPRRACRGSDAPTPAPVSANPGVCVPQPRRGRHPNRGEQGIEQGCGEPALRFALRGGGEWHLPNDLRAILATAFPGVDLDAELAKAAAWCATEPSRRKTASGMGRFLRGWLSRANPGDISTAEPCPQPSADALAFADEIEREIAAKDTAHA